MNIQEKLQRFFASHPSVNEVHVALGVLFIEKPEAEKFVGGTGKPVTTHTREGVIAEQNADNGLQLHQQPASDIPTPPVTDAVKIGVTDSHTYGGELEDKKPVEEPATGTPAVTLLVEQKPAEQPGKEEPAPAEPLQENPAAPVTNEQVPADVTGSPEAAVVEPVKETPIVPVGEQAQANAATVTAEQKTGKTTAPKAGKTK